MRPPGAGSERRTRRDICVGPPEVVGDLPSDVLKNAVSEQSDPQPAHVVEPSLGILLGHFTVVYCLVEQRQHLRAKKRRSQDLVFVPNRYLVVSQANGHVRADHVLGHGRSAPRSAESPLLSQPTRSRNSRERCITRAAASGSYDGSELSANRCRSPG